MRNNWKLSALVFGLGLALGANVFGQASAINGEITGTVADPSGAAISGATVEIEYRHRLQAIHENRGNRVVPLHGAAAGDL
jgi:hypothetical protein